MSQIINGKEIAKKIREGVAKEVAELKLKKEIMPKLVVVLVGEDPASQVYVRMKEKACKEAGIISEILRYPVDLEENKLIPVIDKLNSDASVHGILVQLPLPKQINEKNILARVSPSKDVDGLHIENLGKLLKGENPDFVACTPSGIIELILSTGTEIKGKRAVVVGRSNIVGKPVALLLLQRHATVTICHSRTADLAGACRQAEILVAAVGKPKMIKGDWVGKGAVVIDVGVNRTDAGLVGDVDFEGAKENASYITPVPGGVGPMTIAMLLKNTLIAAQKAPR
ncbi:MAG: bifunctional methylenetetrahydrofolate dehydrogenase/methenyltetrahydrofolate cyclohydrolase FolD [Candidatus Margulisbacteria bacterium]|nr:bifunctional methylenetetrahydrofolate dehydrogenase/methenyltetrahydrofolate cyclohydrolase FolD [Candidatus Margulisiibacteriota bacterium]MBU1021988.1 bifunctional methylenetetrahydrofolate dehydrogenase/methenyltetrahydrofolate cyclohydrolase FolD [Candidatus Margulisiibacteriota bacterium]MBU1728966.1 bifunctional methylenetetrahydrofolate dehydrogenase/methenyltetrahydrofolate cyclohydrolase FolD [Candidatus Margulisiibacteriota bacterium]MBU1954772.1 bifunctional methylenetetrahydrofol